MEFDGLIFDLDGTLWDCSAASAEAFNTIYKKYDVDRQITVEFIRSISGKPSTECDQILLNGIPENLRSLVSQQFDQYEIDAVMKHSAFSLYDGVEEGIIALKKRYKLYVVSNCGQQYLEVFLRHTSIGSLFEDSECHGKTKLLKAENIRSLVKRQNLQSACYIGDTSTDEEAALHAQIPFFYAEYGFGKLEGTYTKFKNFHETTEFFLNL